MVSQQNTLYWLMILRAFLFSLGPVGYVSMVRMGSDPYTTIAYILLTGGALMLVFYVAQYKSVEQTSTISRTRALTLIVSMSIYASVFYVLYALSMQRETIIETTVMARTAIFLAIPLSILFLGSQIKSWRMLALGYFCISLGVLVFKYHDIVSVFNAGAFSIMLGLSIACIGAINDCTNTYLARNSGLQPQLCNGLALLIGGIGLQVILLTTGTSNVIVPSSMELTGASLLGFFTIAIPGVISARVGRDLNKPILVSASTLLGLVFTALLGYILHQQNVAILPFVLMLVLIAYGLFVVNKSEVK